MGLGGRKKDTAGAAAHQQQLPIVPTEVRTVVDVMHVHGHVTRLDVHVTRLGADGAIIGPPRSLFSASAGSSRRSPTSLDPSFCAVRRPTAKYLYL